jgi:DNA-binding transcriptional MerR regulator
MPRRYLSNVPDYQPATDSERRVHVVLPAERRKRLDFIEKLLIAGVSISRIESACREAFDPPMSKTAVRTYISRVHARWAEEERTNRAHYKTQAIRRLYGHIAEARKASNWAAVAQLERLLSDIQGTKEPIEVQVNVDATVTEAMLHVVANLSPERKRALIEEQRRLRALAQGATVDVSAASAPGSTSPQAPSPPPGDAALASPTNSE